MKRLFLLIALVSATSSLFAGEVVKTYTFSNPDVRAASEYQMVQFAGTLQTGKTGEPVLPWQSVSLILPPGEKAVKVDILCEEETLLPGSYLLYPKQEVRPISQGTDGKFIKNENIYRQDTPYPDHRVASLSTGYLGGHAIAMTAFTPVTYHPLSGTVSWYGKVTVTITTEADSKAVQALKNLSGSEVVATSLRSLVQNPEKLPTYPEKQTLKTGYDLLIITPSQFVSGFAPLTDFYNSKSISSQVVTTESIASSMTGQDMPEKIRNFIIQEYQNSSVGYVLLGGDVEHVPYRGLYCYVISGGGYEDYNIPADLYYSALDGNWNTNGDAKWGEPGEDDLLPEVAVSRFPFSTSQELANMVHKSVSYQDTPVLGELTQPFLVGENLYSDPWSWGQDYLELLVDDHSDNGYFTHGIPSEENDITRLYDTLISPPNNIYSWDVYTLLDEINNGKSFIHHAGHSNELYMMRLTYWDITDANFSQVNGVDHNYTLMYTHGCLCGSFDYDDCIAEKCVTIANFLVGGVFNSRYGWFDQGLTEGPSAHLHREFVSALYNDTTANEVLQLGAAHMVSKIKTAPWVGLEGEFEPGAQRWCHYCCNVLGDPVMKVWTREPATAISGSKESSNFTLAPNPAFDHTEIFLNIANQTDMTVCVKNALGQPVRTIAMPGLSAGTHRISIDLSGLSDGIYFVTAGSKGTSQTRKLVLAR